MSKRRNRMDNLTKKYIVLSEKVKLLKKKQKKLKKEILEIFLEVKKEQEEAGNKPVTFFPLDPFFTILDGTEVKIVGGGVSLVVGKTQERTTKWGKKALKNMINYFNLHKDAISEQIDMFQEQILHIIRKYDIDIKDLENAIKIKTKKTREKKLEKLLSPLSKRETKELINLIERNAIFNDMFRASSIEDLAFKIVEYSPYITKKGKVKILEEPKKRTRKGKQQKLLKADIDFFEVSPP